jgi:hypothetical protein
LRGARPAFADLMMRPASASATCGGGGCYKGRRRLLQRVSRSRLLLVAATVATIAVNVCYKGCRRLLLVAAADATIDGGGGCYFCGGGCYKGRGRLLQRAATAATCGGGGCYNRRQRGSEFVQAAPTVAANAGGGCYKQGAVVLQGDRRGLRSAARPAAKLEAKDGGGAAGVGGNGVGAGGAAG